LSSAENPEEKRIERTIMRVFVDKELCIGCEACVDICPEIFEIQDDIAVVKIDDDVPEDLEAAVEEAAEACAVEAITIEE